MKRRDFTRTLAAAAAAATIPGARLGAMAPRRAPSVNGARLNGWMTAIGEFGKNPQGGVTRLAYSEADIAARAFTVQLMRDAQLEVVIDAAGNIYGKRAGTDVSAKPVIFGSHVDSVPEGGNYDGNVGTLAAIEVARTFAEQGVTTKHPLWVACWQNEEGGTWGSHLVTTEPTAAELATVARSGKSIGEGIRYIGGDPAKLASARLRTGDAHGYLELHIEQGGNLDREKLDIGIVEGIVGLREWDVTVDGVANHAGTTPMADRHDAMLAAARFTEMVNRVATSEPGRQVGTVGRIQAFPGAPNVVPGKVLCTLELRDLDDRKIQRLYDVIVAESRKIGARNGTTFAYHEFVTHESALCDERVRSLIGTSARTLGFTTMSLPSGAGHDAQNLARVCPMGMIFIPSVGGISHAPKEYSRPQDITNGANVLLGAVLAMDGAVFR
ncbi:MAG: Zn-dependent hydrolase [Gemmatimonadota bacterium]